MKQLPGLQLQKQINSMSYFPSKTAARTDCLDILYSTWEMLCLKQIAFFHFWRTKHSSGPLFSLYYTTFSLKSVHFSIPHRPPPPCSCISALFFLATKETNSIFFQSLDITLVQTRIKHKGMIKDHLA